MEIKTWLSMLRWVAGIFWTCLSQYEICVHFWFSTQFWIDIQHPRSRDLQWKTSLIGSKLQSSITVKKEYLYRFFWSFICSWLLFLIKSSKVESFLFAVWNTVIIFVDKQKEIILFTSNSCLNFKDSNSCLNFKDYIKRCVLILFTVFESFPVAAWILYHSGFLFLEKSRNVDSGCSVCKTGKQWLLLGHVWKWGRRWIGELSHHMPSQLS